MFFCFLSFLLSFFWIISNYFFSFFNPLKLIFLFPTLFSSFFFFFFYLRMSRISDSFFLWGGIFVFVFCCFTHSFCFQHNFLCFLFISATALLFYAPVCLKVSYFLLSLFLSLSLSFPLALSLSLSLSLCFSVFSLSLTHTHTHTHGLLSLSLSLSLFLTHTYLTLSLSISLSHAFSLSLSLSARLSHSFLFSFNHILCSVPTTPVLQLHVTFSNYSH